ncbi:MAG: hypothetical protein ACLFT4_01390 [Bacteroidales bacterium]
MLLKIVRSNSPFILLLLVALAVVLWLPGFKGLTTEAFTFNQYQMPLYKLLGNITSNSHSVRVIISFATVFLVAIYILKLDRDYILLERRNYSSAIFFILLSGSFIQLQSINPGIFASFALLLALEQLFSTYHKRKILNKIFITGMLISVASLFSLYSVAFLVITWIALILLRGFNLKEWFMPLFGFIFPYIFVFAYYFISDDNSVNGLISIIRQNLYQHSIITHYNNAYFAFYGFIGFLIIFASFSVIKRFQGRKIYIRKFFELFWWIFMLSILIFTLSRGVAVELIYTAAIPLSFLFADYFNSVKSSVFGEIVLFILAGLTYWVYYTNG